MCLPLSDWEGHRHAIKYKNDVKQHKTMVDLCGCTLLTTHPPCRTWCDHGVGPASGADPGGDAEDAGRRDRSSEPATSEPVRQKEEDRLQEGHGAGHNAAPVVDRPGATNADVLGFEHGMVLRWL